MKPELLFEYITLRHNEHTVHSMCRVLHVSESGYYRSVCRIAGTKSWQLLLVKIREIYAETPDNRNYGVRRIQLALEQRGIRVSRSGVRRVMKRGGLLKSAPHRTNSLTKADATAQKAESHSARFLCSGAKSKVADRYHASPVRRRKALHRSRSGLL